MDAASDPHVATLLRRTTAVLSEPPDELTRRRHLGAMSTEARRADREPTGFRAAGVAVAAGLALVVTLAGLGSLPAPAQEIMAGVAERIGITLPRPAGESPGTVRDVDVRKQWATHPEGPGTTDADRGAGSFPGAFPKPDGWPGHADPQPQPGSGDSRGPEGARGAPSAERSETGRAGTPGPGDRAEPDVDSSGTGTPRGSGTGTETGTDLGRDPASESDTGPESPSGTPVTPSERDDRRHQDPTETPDSGDGTGGTSETSGLDREEPATGPQTSPADPDDHEAGPTEPGRDVTDPPSGDTPVTATPLPDEPPETDR